MLAGVRDSQSGSEEGARQQLVDELRATSRKVRKQFLKEAGITPKIQYREGLATKADLVLPWRKLCHLRR